LGNLVPEIKKITENENFDFVVMGTKGPLVLKKLFSTIATKVMNDVTALVLQYQTLLISYRKNTVYYAIQTGG
jgi:hypothetical protein